MKKIICGALLLLFGVQIAYLGNTIIEAERTLSQGTLYRLQTAPIDPYDAFRGRYVWLSFALDNRVYPLDIPSCAGWRLHPTRWASLKRDPHDVAEISALSLEKPAQGDAIRVRITFCNDEGLSIHLPFQRFFANELLAPAMEQQARKHAGKSYLHLRVRGDYAVPERLEIPNFDPSRIDSGA